MEIEAIDGARRPDPSLFNYYALTSLVLGPFFFFLLIPLYFRYHTLVYRFDDEGVSMKWGILFRKEISLTYSRIQDIHLSSNFIERWLGLAKIQVQTASGSSGAEMTIEGLKDFAEIRDYLYTRMRGVKAGPSRAAGSIGAGLADDDVERLTAALETAVSELRTIRVVLEKRSSGGDA